MSKDPHLKRQKQIRMSDEVRERFEKAQKKSKLTGERFIEALLNAHEGKNQPTNAELLDMLKERLK